MGWKDQLRPASFKGVNFKVEDHEAEGGRRLVVNEYPYRDLPYTEDMGRAARRYNVTAYVLGQNYMATRDALIDAIEAGGANTLVHPYLGTKSVICETYRLRETKNEGGYCVISMSLVEAGSKTFPNGAPVPTTLVSMRADELISAAKDSFVNGMTVTGVSEWVRDAYSDTLGSAAGIFDIIRTNGGINAQTTAALVNKAALWVADVADLSSPSLSLIRDLSGAADRLINTLAGVFDLAPNASTSTKNLQRFISFTNPRVGSLTSNGIIADNNAEISETFIRTAAIAVEAKSAVAQTYPTLGEALNAREYLLTRIDALAANTRDDGIYDSFRQLRTEIAAAIPGEDNDLPSLSNVTLKESVPSLVLAYDLYEGVSREQDIIDRNEIRHPAFLPGGTDLSVIKDVESTT